MQLEAVAPSHRALPVSGNSGEHPVGVPAQVVAHGYHRAVDERYSAATPEGAKAHENEHLHEHARHQLDEPVVGQGIGKTVCNVLPYEKQVIVLEVAECAEMEIYEYGHYLAFRHTAWTLAVVLTIVIAADFQVFLRLGVKFL